MNNIIFKSLILLIILILSNHSYATTWRMAFKTPINSPEGLVFQHFAEKVNEYSSGDMQIILYPNEQLGKDDAVLEQLKLGIIQLYAEDSSFMKKWTPEIKWTSPPFLFDDRQHWVRFMNSDLVNDWYEKASQDAGITLLGDKTSILRGPYRVMVSKSEILSFDDIENLKLRLSPSQLSVKSWVHLKADVKTLSWTDVYQSLQKGIVEAVNSPVSLVESMRFHEVAPYLTRHDESFQSLAIMMNKKKYDELPSNLKLVLEKSYFDAADFSHEIIPLLAHESLNRMKSEGVKYREIDRRPIIKKIKELYKVFSKNGDLPDGYLLAIENSKTDIH